jgi:hypothetical protein
MTPAKMFEGDLWVLASDAVQMAQNAYKNGQADERKSCISICDEAAEDMTDMAKWGAQTCSKLIKARGQA